MAMHDSYVVVSGNEPNPARVLVLVLSEGNKYVPIPSRLKVEILDNGAIRIEDKDSTYALPSFSNAFSLEQFLAFWPKHLGLLLEFYGLLSFGRESRRREFFKVQSNLNFLTPEQRKVFDREVSNDQHV